MDGSRGKRSGGGLMEWKRTGGVRGDGKGEGGKGRNCTSADPGDLLSRA